MSNSVDLRIDEAQVLFHLRPAWHAWLDEHHEKHEELWVGFHKVGSGKPSITWPEAVDSALCFGWIDGVRKSLGETSYVIRFTPRRREERLERGKHQARGGTQRAGLDAAQGQFKPSSVAPEIARKSTPTSKEKAPSSSGAYEKQFRANKKAWKFFQAQPPWYRRTASWWVISAKKEETRLKRLGQLIEDSENERTIRELRRQKMTRLLLQPVIGRPERSEASEAEGPCDLARSSKTLPSFARLGR